MRAAILQAIAQADSRSPVAVSALAQQLGAGVDALAAALDGLYAERQINRAEVTRRGATAMVVWPTGIPERFSPASFTIHPKGRTPPPQKEPLMPRNAILSGQAVLEAISASPAGITRAALIAEFGAANTTRVDACLQYLVRGDKAHRRARGLICAGPAPVATATEPPPAAPADQPQVSGHNSGSTSAVTSSPAAGRAVEPEPPGAAVAKAPGAAARRAKKTSEPASPVEFCLWNDGRLVIRDNDEAWELPPEDTKRLARFILDTHEACLGAHA